MFAKAGQNQTCPVFLLFYDTISRFCHAEISTITVEREIGIKFFLLLSLKFVSVIVEIKAKFVFSILNFPFPFPH